MNKNLGIIETDQTNSDFNINRNARNITSENPINKLSFPIEEKSNNLKSEEKQKLINYYKNEVLIGIIVSFVLITQLVAYAFIARVDPSIAIHSGWIVGIICAIFGGRPGMINGMTGGCATMIALFVGSKKTESGSGEGVEILFPATIFAGFLILLCGILNLGKLKGMLPSTVKIGFCNGLAIIIAMGQQFSFKDPDGKFVTNTILGLTFVYAIISALIFDRLPKINYKIFKLIPSSLVSIIVIVIIEFAITRPIGGRTYTLGDISPFSSETAYPKPFFVGDRYNLNALEGKDAATKIIQYGFTLAAMAVMETLMTTEVVNDFTKTDSDSNRQFYALGTSNLISGFLGAGVGGAMLGISTINCVNGGKGRISSFVSALLLMIFIFGAYPLLNYIPIGVLIGMMIIVIYRLFKWWTLKAMLAAIMPQKLRDKLNFKYKINRVDTSIIVIVTVMTVTINLLIACLSGIIIAGTFYAYLATLKVVVKSELIKKGEKTIKIYHIEGPLFYGTKLEIFKHFDVINDPAEIQLQLIENQYMDYTFLEGLSIISKRYKDKNKSLKLKKISLQGKKIIEKSDKIIQQIEFLGDEDVEIPEVVFPHTYSSANEVQNLIEDEYFPVEEPIIKSNAIELEYQINEIPVLNLKNNKK